jgi:hypothetical protein
MRLAKLPDDGWELDSAEERHRLNPDSFRIPPAAERASLTRGQGAKLVFLIEGVEEDGTVCVHGERMWVVVAGRRAGCYVGILVNEPAEVESGEEEYLVVGAEIPFGPEHVIDIDEPPAEYAAEWLVKEPARHWPPPSDEPVGW